MNRYRSYAPADDQPIEDGDISLLGVNQYDTAENLPPGLCQAATNIDFTTQDGVTRGGFVCIPSLGNAPFGAGTNWVAGVSAADSLWSSVAYGNGRYVAVAVLAAGVNDVMYSADGLTWTAISTGITGDWTAIVFAAGKFVAVAESGSAGQRIMTSTDGATWAAQVTPANLIWRAITYGNGLFVAVSADGGSQQAMTSPDAVTWTRQSTDATAQNQWVAITYGNGLFVAVADTGTGNRVMTSPDGVTWTARTSPADIAWIGVVYGGATYVAVSQTGTTSSAMTSTDGITWTIRTTPGTNWNAVAYGNAQFMAVGSDGAPAKDAMTSPNGINWTASTAPNGNGWWGITHGPNAFVAVAQSGTGNRAMAIGLNSSVFATGSYSDPNDTTSPWIVLAGTTKAGFFAFGQTSRTVAYPVGYVISEASCIVQANNLLFIFSGPNQSPIQWNGAWGGMFVTCPASTLGAGFEDIPPSNQATYYQNRLWVPNNKDTLSASELLDFKNFNILTESFNLNVGDSDYLVSSYPFANNSLVVFKNHSSYLLQNVSGTLANVTSTEITRQLGIIGLNACCAVGPDLIYFSSERNITSIRLNIQNATQNVTVPLSRDINPIIDRVNWTYADKISMGYNNNLLYVALPLDNATVCSSVIVFNFITGKWFGEWNFAPELNMAIQDFIDSNYLGKIQMHAVTEDGRIFVIGSGQNDISGTTVCEISASLTTRAYASDNNSKVPRRMYVDLGTNRPNFTIEAFADGANESSVIITNQTYSRSQSWLFNDAPYVMDNSNDDYNRAFRKDYSSGPNSIQCGSGFQPEMLQSYRLPIITRRKGRLSWFKITNTTGKMVVNSIGVESRAGDRSSLTQVG